MRLAGQHLQAVRGLVVGWPAWPEPSHHGLPAACLTARQHAHQAAADSWRARERERAARARAEVEHALLLKGANCEAEFLIRTDRPVHAVDEPRRLVCIDLLAFGFQGQASVEAGGGHGRCSHQYEEAEEGGRPAPGTRAIDAQKDAKQHGTRTGSRDVLLRGARFET